MKAAFALSLRPAALACCLLLWLAGCAEAGKPYYCPPAPLSIQTQRGIVRLTVEVATTDAQQEHGLMYRKHLARDHGMLFAFAKPQPIAFWMKNTLIPLDMLFIDKSGSISKIVTDAPPLSLDPIFSDSNAIVAVIELGGGAARYYHIAKGDKVLYAGFP